MWSLITGIASVDFGQRAADCASGGFVASGQSGVISARSAGRAWKWF
jgi:hypothetical protein